MGEQRVSSLKDREKANAFMKAVLNDIQALDHMLDNEYFENDIIRIGAEQEMIMVDKKTQKPVFIAMEALEKLKDYDWVETEISQFNLETNFEPRVFEGDCFSEMEKENRYKLNIIQKKLDELNAQLILTGILPTLRKHHIDIKNITPKKRYKALMDAFASQNNKKKFKLKLEGIDELVMNFDSALLESVNTSFQVHLQVSSDKFVKMYNISQALAGPILAISANSPLVFGKRLWHESRIAMFQQSLDTRGYHDYMREKTQRVSFGKEWLGDSILNIYKEDITRFRVLMSSDIEEDSLETISNNKVPNLRALQVHNSTVYRWNRPCYGISSNGKPHLRIENRVLPSGPTVQDEIANACFWLGLMIGMNDKVDDIRDHMSFVDAKDNFEKAARFGIDSKFTWFNDEKITVIELIKKHLLPIARKGLKIQNIDNKDINKYLGIIEGRVNSKLNGARWILKSYTKLKEEVHDDEALSILTASIIKHQSGSLSGHEWPMPEIKDLPEYKPHELIALEFMNTDLFTVHKDDLIQFVMEMMNWRKLKYISVEDEKANLIGLVTMRTILKEVIKHPEKVKDLLVEDIMVTDLYTISPQDNLVDALKILKDNKIGCLPVIDGKKLVGMITEMDFLNISSRLLERMD